MSELMTAMALMLNAFQKYASTDGDKNTLSKSEVRTLMEKEFDFKNSMDPSGVDKLMKSLDHDKDGVVDFTEFMTLIACLTICMRAPDKK